MKNLKKLKDNYNQILSERKEIIEQINDLEEDETVKKYIELHSKNKELETQQKDLYKQIKVGEYSSCNHIWVHVLHDYDSLEGRSYDYHGCIKCGLDNSVLFLKQNYGSANFLAFDQRIMYDYITSDYPYNSGISADLSCDFDLAKAYYAKIKEIHPDADDETIVKYLRVAVLAGNVKENDERKRKQKR